MWYDAGPMRNSVLKKVGGLAQNLDKQKIIDVFVFIEQEKYLEYANDRNVAVKLFDLLLPLCPDTDALISILLYEFYKHDILGEKEVKEKFGDGILGILRKIKKIEGLSYAENNRAARLETLRMVFFAMAKDIRVVLILLVLRLRKMQEFKIAVPERSREIVAKETLNLYVPVAARLGVYGIKGKLEDFAFKYSNPKDYEDIFRQVVNLRKKCSLSIEFVRDKLVEFLKSRGVKASVSGRIKNVYSIYQKLRKKGLNSVSDLYDVFAIRVVLPSMFDESGKQIIDKLYYLLGLLHSEWRPISKRFKDYVAVPKPNGYRSLHTVVLGIAPKDMDQPVEIQLRDEWMHMDAEYGIASHWLYKERLGVKVNGLSSHVEWIKNLEEVRRDFKLDESFVKDMDVDIFKDRIFVLTPRGEVKDLPVSAIPIDFAYSVHTDIGHRCVMAKVNGSIVPLDYELKNGDVVEIITRNDATPRLRWVSIVKTSLARDRIKAWHSAESRENHLKSGRRLVNEQLERIGKPSLDQNYSIFAEYLGKKLPVSRRESLIEEVGKGGKMASDVVRKIYPYEESVVDKIVAGRSHAGTASAKGFGVENKILIGGESFLPVKIASCCVPKFGDKIVGYVTRGKNVSVHKVGCVMLDSLDRKRVVFAGWKGERVSGEAKYCVSVCLRVEPRFGLLSDIIAVVASMGVDVADVTIGKNKEGIYEDCLLLEMDDLDKFDVLLDKLEEIDGVSKVLKIGKCPFKIEKD